MAGNLNAYTTLHPQRGLVHAMLAMAHTHKYIFQELFELPGNGLAGLSWCVCVVCSLIISKIYPWDCINGERLPVCDMFIFVSSNSQATTKDSSVSNAFWYVRIAAIFSIVLHSSDPGSQRFSQTPARSIIFSKSCTSTVTFWSLSWQCRICVSRDRE